MNNNRYLAIALGAIVAFSPAFSQDNELAISLEGVRFLYSLIPSGVDLSLTYTGLELSGAADTKLFLKAGGGYQDTRLLRDQFSGDPSLLQEDGEILEFNKTNFQWELAFLQGFTRRDDGKNLLEAFAFYRGRFDIYPTDGISAAVFSDMQGLFGTSVMGGISYDSRVLDRHRSKSGMYAEATAEWGPGALNAGTTDFWRVSGQVRGFLPVYDIPTDGGNLFNVYLAGFAGVDYADGQSVPIYVNQSFGGRNLRGSLGDNVRGYGWNAYDSSFKSVANAELRLVGPKIWLDSIVPYLFGFVDAGYYAGLADASAATADAAGILASTGGGIAIDLVGFAQVSVIAGLKLVDDQLYGPADAFFWGLKFFLHF